MTLDMVDLFVDVHGLHRSSPVDLSPVADLYRISDADLSTGVLGFAFVHRHRALVGVNQHLDPYTRRMVIAHECAHILLNHPNSMYLCYINDWLYQRYELMAQQAAARILICREPLLEMAHAGATVGEIACAFEVPEVLVDLRMRQVTMR